MMLHLLTQNFQSRPTTKYITINYDFYFSSIFYKEELFLVHASIRTKAGRLNRLDSLN